MKSSSLINCSLIIFLFSFITAGAYSQETTTQNSEFVPHVGQEGKDVVWVPTPDELVNKMMEIAKVTPQDILMDLGSGDGRTVIAAAKIGAMATGIEYNPEMVALSKKNAEAAGVSDKAKFLNADLFESDFSQATVITMFLLPSINLKLRPRLLDLKPGTRIVSNTFDMGEWVPDIEVNTDNNSSSWSTALMWIIPAKVQGIWKLGQDELDLRQNFQMVSGTLKHGTATSNISEGRLKGDIFTFVIDGAKYTGQVTGKNTMSGTVLTTSGKSSDWSATLK